MPRRRNHGQALPVGPLATAAVAQIVDGDRLRLTRVQMAWPSIVPSPLRARVWPASIQRDQLTLVVLDHQWLHELVYHQNDLLRRIGASVPNAGVTRIRTRVGVVPPPEATKEPVPAARHHSLTDEPSRDTRAALADVEDPALRQVMANARLALSDRLMNAPPRTAGRRRGR